MEISGIEGLSAADINREIQRGAKFVMYQYCISILVMTFKRPSDIYFIRGGESGISKGLSYSAITLLLGWWGIPWGPIYSITSLVNNFSGGKDVTAEIIQSMNQSAAAPEAK